MSDNFLPYGRQSIAEDDIEAVVDVLKSDWLTTGPAVSDFETAFRSATAAPHALACSNGTTALHLALAGLGIGEGDVCIVPAITFLATANAALFCGAEVVFCDVDADTGLMTQAHLEEALGRAGDRAAAVLPVHLAGQAVDMAAISSIARTAQLRVVEDACHALGTVHAGLPVGACHHSDAATFSFHPVKTIAAGEGGMVTTRDAVLAQRIARLRSHGMERSPEHLERGADEPWWYEMQSLGWNYRLTDIQAALARSQLKRLDQFKRARQALAQRYDEALAELAPHILPIRRTPDTDACLHLYPVRIDFEAVGVTRAELMNALRQRGVGTQVHYIPLYKQPFYRQRYGQTALDGAERYYAHTLSLPLYAGLDADAPDRVVNALSEVLGL
ncbi:MAG: UDP-4-amino-4,6-dideoxy-N-acetyl-beta-L-altrosamine transaminase [Maricaulis sp.]|uniref:UDP-4-amino-4, 6-dideoxy-N-acetyl-beta-L-altrosamine transaminase n=1 Tax=Maricaulis sp. TaxID=1486257 RepID=UPI001B112246|nr:UDP-4-amino-4,6-dideoxy-N-acetyl-beta-L-altrosamine transaminase [Maricaulis sp.]MBO6847127.1 UDP-4-amino-4,6-dideoxy-N-acetyl-beta-L-altrosamine transaminase [Maricaulis sp.]MBO6876785.1 UDP-4-amino-4,6-dideoxy-N-acetyl-beta-L-altrosamine transaminase [Maricaulis sp.]